MKQCTNCGAELNDEAVFCTTCGQPVSEPMQEQPPMPAYPNMPVYEAPPEMPVYEQPAAPFSHEQQSAEPNYADPSYIPQQPTYAEQYESQPVQETGYAPVPANAPKKKSKGKLIALIIAGILLIGAGIGAYFLITWYNSPEQEIKRMLEDKQYANAQALVAQNVNLRYNKDLENQVSERLEGIKSDFTNKTVDYAAATSELDSIEKLELEGLKSRIPEYRTFINNINQSRTDMGTAEKFYAEGNYPEALEHFRKVIKEDPDYEKANTRITETVNAYRTKVLDDAAKYAETGAYASAVTTLDAGLVVLPDDAELSSQKALYEKKNLDSIKADALTQAEAAATNKDYVNALSILDKYTAEYGTDAEVSVKRNEYLESYVDAVLAQVDDLQNNKDFAGAVAAIDEGLKVATEHTRLTNRRTSVVKAYAEYTCAEADKLAEEKKFDEALKLINDALKIAPEDKTLTDKKTEIEEMKPIPITSLVSLNAEHWNWNDGTAVDPFGNDYSGTSNYVVFHNKSSDERSIEYRVNGNYQMVTGVIAPHAEIDKDGTCTVLVYADERLVYTSPAIDQKTDAVTFSAAISDAEYIKIEVRFSKHYVFDVFVEQLIISDVQLWP